MPLTDTSIKSAKTKDKPLKLFDGGGLFLLVTPAGGKWWRLKYRFRGKEKLLALGIYPAVSLKEARKRRDEAKELLASGVDPSVQKQEERAAVQAEQQKQESTLELVAREWYDKHLASWTPAYSVKVLAQMERDIFPPVGRKPTSSLTAPELLDVLRKVESRGAVETAHRLLQICGQIFRYAIATGRAERDPAADLKGALTPFKSTSFATMTDPTEISALLRDIESYTGNTIVRSALKLAPYVFVRPGELRRAEWAEFNLEGAEWRIPAERMKMRVVHIVPLARQVVDILEDLRQYSGHTRYLFPSMRANTAPISDVTLLAALRRMGHEKGSMTVHGFRSMASTLLNEQGYNRDWIERQLAHGEKNSVRAAYNYAEYLPERRRMMQEWADYLDGLREQS